MSSNYIMFHDCSAIIARAHSPGNGNAVTLRVMRGDDAANDLDIVLFGLPEETTETLIRALVPKADPPPDFRDDQDETDVKRPWVALRDPDRREEWEL